MGAYGEHSSWLRNFEGFKLFTNLKETKEAKCNIGGCTTRHYVDLTGLSPIIADAPSCLKALLLLFMYFS